MQIITVNFVDRANLDGCLEYCLKVELEGYETQLRELNTYSEKLTREYNEKVELQEVLEKARRFFMTDAPRLAVSELADPAARGRASQRKPGALLAGADDEGRGGHDMDMRFSSITGVVSTEEKGRFERMSELGFLSDQNFEFCIRITEMSL